MFYEGEMINIPKGTKDILPQESYKWHFIENIIRELSSIHGLLEIRTPTFEHTELFLRGVGDTTDIVNKEMYSFLDKGDRSITLKPEGTAGVARAYIENGLGSLPQPIKMYYLTSVFRYEKPQAGRLREHHQFGVELFGTYHPLADVEIISIASSFFRKLGIEGLTLKINNIGCKKCRQNYNDALKEFFSKNSEDLCPICNARINKNPLRVLDCKELSCKKVILNAPICTDFLCAECKAHKETVEQGLNSLSIDYTNDPYLVRGLDYYTGTVFEFVSEKIGAQGTVCGGGRYNDLVEEIGGKSTPAVGFGLGIERLLLLMEAMGVLIREKETTEVFVIPQNDSFQNECLKVISYLRENGISAENDLSGRSFKSQLKYANKMGFKYLMVIGETEVNSGIFSLKNMANGEIIELNKIELVSFFRR
jgi:histidyl-tRNA synthetase